MFLDRIEEEKYEIIKKVDLANRINISSCKDYFIGVHGIDLYNYKEYVLKTRGKDFNIPYIKDTDNINQITLYQNMLKYGINVPYSDATSTIWGLGIGKNITAKNLNYSFESIDDIFNVIVAIPPYMIVDDKQYFVGDIARGNKDTNLLTRCVLKKWVPREYIYGYYKANHYKDEEIIFQINSKHISFMSYDEQKNFFKRLVNGTNLDMNLLEMVYNEKINTQYPAIVNYGVDKHNITMTNIIGNTINKKRIYENQDIPQTAVSKVLKKSKANTKTV